MAGAKDNIKRQEEQERAIAHLKVTIAELRAKLESQQPKSYEINYVPPPGSLIGNYLDSPKYATGYPEVPPPRAEVTLTIQTITKQVAELDDLMGLLHNKLSLVLPANGQAVGPESGTGQGCRTELGTQLSSISSRLTLFSQRLHRLIDNIDL